MRKYAWQLIMKGDQKYQLVGEGEVMSNEFKYTETEEITHGIIPESLSDLANH